MLLLVLYTLTVSQKALCEKSRRAPSSMIEEAKGLLSEVVMRRWEGPLERTTPTRENSERRALDQRARLGPSQPPQNDYIFGDILMSPEQVRDLIRDVKEQLSGRHPRQKSTGRWVGLMICPQPILSHHNSQDFKPLGFIIAGGNYNLWRKTSPIPYQFHRNVSKESQDLIHQSMQLWQENTCLRFQKSRRTTNRLEFQNGPRCASYVGMMGGLQTVEIAEPQCVNIGTISHEIGHALGFFHEHNRPDRDTYIRINASNIRSDAHHAFALRTARNVHKLAKSATYEYGSVMHYSGLAFANNEAERTILPQSGYDGYQWTMGQRQGPSFLDYYQINQIYCDRSCKGYSTECQNGGYPNPNSCWKCLCPRGFDGRWCQKAQKSRNCPGSGEIRITEKKQSIQTPNYPRKFSKDTECIWLLKAEEGSVIRYEIVEEFHLACDRVCDADFLEIKAEQSMQRTGHRYCCKGIPFEGTKDSKTNQMILMMKNSGTSYKGFRINVWAVSSVPEAALKKCSVEVPKTSFSIDATPPSLKRQKYKFAIIGGEYYWPSIHFWTSVTGDSNYEKNAKFPFRYHSATALPNSNVLVTGGMNCLLKPSNKYFHLVHNDGFDIKRSGDMPGPPRNYLSSAHLPDGRVIVCGGWNPDDGYLSSCLLYNDGCWSNASSMNSRRGYFYMASDNEYAYAVGGYDGDTDLASAQRYNSKTDEWEPIKALPGGYRFGLSLVHSKNRLYALGGDGGRTRVEVYDTRTRTWSRGPNLIREREHHCAVS